MKIKIPLLIINSPVPTLILGFLVMQLLFAQFLLAGASEVRPSSSQLIVLKVHDIHSLQISTHEPISLDQKEILQLKDQGSSLLINGRKEGEAHLRVGTRTYKVVIVSQEKMRSFELLTTFLKFTPELKLDHSENFFHIHGKLAHPSTWLTLGNLTLNHFKFDVETTPEQINVVEYFLNKQLSQEAFFPVRILQEPYATVRLPKEVLQNHRISELLNHYGINIKTDQKSLYSEPLIRVQVVLAEIRKSFARNVGIEWPYQASAKILPTGVLSADGDLKILANFLETRGHGRILASPVLVAKSGSDADFFAGGEFPIKTKTKQTQTVIWKKYGISLKIKPTADADGKLSLEVKSEVSSIDTGEKVDGIPSLFTNTVSSQFDLHQSQTIALSGLVKKVDGESLKQWPGLGQIPVLGNLFTSSDYQEDKTELIVLVTPALVKQQ